MCYNYKKLEVVGIQYLPILKWKQGEREALANLSPNQRSKITPIIEIVDERSPDQFIEELKFYQDMVYFDTLVVDEDRSLLTLLIDKACKGGTLLAPVLYPDDIVDADSLPFDKLTSIAVRLPVPENIEGPTHTNTFRMLQQLASQYSLKISLIIDLGIITESRQASIAYALLDMFLKQFSVELVKYKQIAICSSSFPETLTDIEAGSSASYRRYDIRLLQRLLNDESVTTSIRNRLAYSDYGVTKFTETDIDFSRLRYGILPKVRYTTDESYYVLKGKKDHTTGEMIVSYKDLARKLKNAEFYFGKDFSYGDTMISEIAMPNDRIGNSKNWVTYCVNHHVSVVIAQLSTLSDA